MVPPTEESANETPDLPPGIAARYRVVKRLGAGGMGDVYLAEDLQLPRRVALKTVLPELAENEDVRKRIERECQSHAKIGAHPHIVTLHDRLEEDGRIYLVMEYVEGSELTDLLRDYARRNDRLPTDDAIRIVVQTQAHEVKLAQTATSWAGGRSWSYYLRSRGRRRDGPLHEL